MDRRAFYCDVDDTLLLHNLSSFPKELQITVECNGRSFVGVPHQANINFLIKMWKLGYEVIVWSKTGKSWASAVTKALGIEQYVDHCLTKPDFYMDDLEVDHWMGPRIYKAPFKKEEV